MAARKLLMFIIERHKADARFVEVEFDRAGGAAAVLGKNEVGNILAFGVGIVIVFAIKEHDNIGVLLDGARFAEIGEHRNLWTARFYGAGELGQGYHGDI